MITVYGIKNCDTVKKALSWLAEHDIKVHFYDYRQNGVDQKLVQHFMTLFAWQDLVNKRSTTWRNLTSSQKDNLDKNNVVELLVNNPTIIKRPIVLSESTALLGFDKEKYINAFKDK